MPFVHVTSNVATSSVKVDETLLLLSKAMATALNKPELFVMTKLDLDTPMTFGGSLNKCAFVDVRSIGGITEEQNAKNTEALTEAVAKALNISAEGVYVTFTDIPAINWGYNKVLVKTML